MLFGDNLSYNQAMIRLRDRDLILITIGFVIVFLFLNQYNTKNKVNQGLYSPSLQLSLAASPSPSPSPSPTVAPVHCLDEKKISEITAVSYHLQNEQFFADDMLLECKYEAEQTVTNITPTVTYLLRIQTAQAQGIWQAQLTADQNKPSYRRIEEDASLFADVNPVKELSQVSFYGWRNLNYVQLDYTPVQEAVGVELDKGKRVTEAILTTSN